MAKEASFRVDGKTFTATLTKVDRDKVYGWVEERYLDKKGSPLTWATLLLDGKSLIGTGGTALKTLDPDGEEVLKSTLQAVLPDGSPAEIQKSVYDAPVDLDISKTVDDFMQLEVKAVYQLAVSDGIKDLRSILDKYPVLYFKFNYRADYEADDAFIICQGEHVFIITGVLQAFEYALPEKPAVVDTMEEESDGSLDFNMF